MQERTSSRAITLLALAAVLMSFAVPASVAAAPPGTALAWGQNTFGQLGDGTMVDRYSPVQVLNPVGTIPLSDIIAVSTSVQHSLALMSDGTVWAWGANASGQLGYNSTNPSSTAVGVSNLTSVTAVGAGEAHSLALKSDGTVWAWGNNSSGQLGDSTTTNRLVPVQVQGPGGAGTLTGIIAISAGGAHSLALRNDGTVWAWGFNPKGQLGDGTTTNRTTPVQTLSLAGGSGISAGESYSIAVSADGSVWAWGDNGSGQLGDGTTTTRLTPVTVVGQGGIGNLSGVASISAGTGAHSLALKSDGSVWTWGSNSSGELGNGTTSNSFTPVQVIGPGGSGTLSGIVAISAGRDHNLALKSDGSVYAWGSNSNGQLGINTTTSHTSPVQVLGLGGTGTLKGTAIAAGAASSLAVASSGVTPHDERYFAATGFRVDNDTFWDFFNKRGGLRTFGFPVSRTFVLKGSTVQFFQREIMQLAPDGSARTLNILDPGLMPYTTINGATFPAPDPTVTSQAPVPGTPGYDAAIQAFVQSHAPDVFEGQNTNYYRTFSNTVALDEAFPEGGGDPNLLFGLNLELWGIPTSNPARDPNNSNFIYLRFQRGVMHFDATNNVTQGLLLADYLKSILTGENLPSDLAAQASGSQFFKQYNPAKSNWVDRPAELPNTDLTNAFETQ